MGILELINHTPDMGLDFKHLFLDVLNLAFFSSDLVFHISHLFGKVLFDLSFVLVVHLEKLLMTLDLGFDVFVLFFNHIDFTVKHIDIIEERNVLLLSFDESGDNFLDRADSSRLFNLLKCILDDLYVSDIHIHEVLFLLVVCLHLIET